MPKVTLPWVTLNLHDAQGNVTLGNVEFARTQGNVTLGNVAFARAQGSVTLGNVQQSDAQGSHDAQGNVES